MSPPRTTQRTTSSITPRRAARAQRSSNSSSGSSSLTSPNSKDAVRKSLADYSPSSEALSLTDEFDLDEEEEEDDRPEELDEEWDFEPKVRD